jgi:voltage-gated potassium channel
VAPDADRPERRAKFHEPVNPADGRGRLHFASRRFSPVRNITVRFIIAALALAITALLVYLQRGCYADRGLSGTLTPVDALYYATVSLSTTGYGDIVPVCESSRLANIFIVTPLRFLFLIVLVGTTVEVLTQRTREEFRSARWRKHVKDHTVIIGYGVKGRAAARSLLDNGVPGNHIVVVTPDRAAVDEATRAGLVGVIGDARREDVLRDAAVDKASRIIVATDEDDTSVLVTLTARRLAPTAMIVASVRESQNADILRQSGADTVIPTAEAAGRLMGLSLISPVAGDLMEDLLDSGRGLEVMERDITREELGLAPTALDARGQIVLAVIRSGEVHRFDRSEVTSLEQGDRLVVIRHNSDHPGHGER